MFLLVPLFPTNAQLIFRAARAPTRHMKKIPKEAISATPGGCTVEKNMPASRKTGL